MNETSVTHLIAGEEQKTMVVTTNVAYGITAGRILRVEAAPEAFISTLPSGAGTAHGFFTTVRHAVWHFDFAKLYNVGDHTVALPTRIIFRTISLEIASRPTCPSPTTPSPSSVTCSHIAKVESAPHRQN